MNRRARIAAALILAASLAGCEFDTERVPGPFDPGQSTLPDTLVVTEICGSQIVDSLQRVSDTYVDVYAEWERYQAYRDAIGDDGVSAEEFAGMADRRDNLERDIRSYQRSVENARRAGSRVDGMTAARCDSEVMAVFEQVVAGKQPEIDFVTSESLVILDRLRPEPSPESETPTADPDPTAPAAP